MDLLFLLKIMGILVAFVGALASLLGGKVVEEKVVPSTIIGGNTRVDRSLTNFGKASLGIALIGLLVSILLASFEERQARRTSQRNEITTSHQITGIQQTLQEIKKIVTKFDTISVAVTYQIPLTNSWAIFADEIQLWCTNRVLNRPYLGVGWMPDAQSRNQGWWTLNLDAFLPGFTNPAAQAYASQSAILAPILTKLCDARPRLEITRSNIVLTEFQGYWPYRADFSQDYPTFGPHVSMACRTSRDCLLVQFNYRYEVAGSVSNMKIVGVSDLPGSHVFVVFDYTSKVLSEAGNAFFKSLVPVQIDLEVRGHRASLTNIAAFFPNDRVFVYRSHIPNNPDDLLNGRMFRSIEATYLW